MSEAEQQFRSHGTKLVFEFDNEEAAHYFKSWLCGSGEQEYWLWMETGEERYEGNITGLRFNYHSGNETIKVECGRMDND